MYNIYNLFMTPSLRELPHLGNVLVLGSRKFTELENYLMLATQWHGGLKEMLHHLDVPEGSNHGLHVCLTKLTALFLCKIQ